MNFDHKTTQKNKYYIFTISAILILVSLYYHHFGRNIKINNHNLGRSSYSSPELEIVLKDGALIDIDQQVFTVWAKSFKPEIEIKNKTDSVKKLIFVVKNIDTKNSKITITGKTEIKKFKNKLLLKLTLDKNSLSQIKIYPDKETETFTFAVIGDTRGGENPFTNRRGSYFIYRQFEKEIKKIQPLFWINLGDMVNSGHLYQYRRLRKQITHIPFTFFPVIGNHEIVDPDGEKYFYLLFGEINYSFSYNNYHFTVLDNSLGDFSKENFEWLENDLKKNIHKNIIILTHMPLFDPRPGGNHAMENKENAWLLEEILKKYKVKYVFASHIHGYYRTTRKGIEYYITGGGGAKLESKNDFYHYLLVKAEKNNLKVELNRLEPPFIFKLFN